MKFIITLIVLLPITGCSDTTVSPGDVTLGKEFSLKFQETVQVSNELMVTFLSYEESRCPEGVQCIRAGELFATLQFKGDIPETQVSAKFCVAGECTTKNSSLQAPILYSGDKIKVGNTSYFVKIQDFAPKQSSQSPREESYRLSLLIEK